MARRRQRKSDEAPGWVWMLFGLGIGLIIALGVYLNGPQFIGGPGGATNAARPATVAELPPPAVPPAQAEPDPDARRADDSAPGLDSAAAATASGDDQTENSPEDAVQDPPGDPGEDPNRFSFYDLLPSFEVVIPEVETPAAARADVAAIEAPGIYMLQAGSFLTEADAEAQRARLGLLGIESRIQRVSIDDRTFHRVRVGPIEDLAELNSVRARLRSANVDSMIMRIDP